MYCSLSIKINTRETQQAKIVDAFYLRLFPHKGQQKPEHPLLEFHGWQWHYMGSIGVLGSPSYICDCSKEI